MEILQYVVLFDDDDVYIVHNKNIIHSVPKGFIVLQDLFKTAEMVLNFPEDLKVGEETRDVRQNFEGMISF